MENLAIKVKICGITTPEQGKAIAQLGANALGFICAAASPRYVTPAQIRDVVDELNELESAIDRVGVFVDAELETIQGVVEIGGLNSVQLHGSESIEFCERLRAALPETRLIKALRVRDRQVLDRAYEYGDRVDWLLLDAYHPQLAGGTGTTLDWSSLQQFRPGCPWLLAGGLTPENITTALTLIHPGGIDLSSGVEISPGNKDLDKVRRLFAELDRIQGKSPAWLR